MPDVDSEEFIAARRAAMAKQDGWKGHDDLDPKGPSGHAYGLRTSTRLTSYYRQTHRKQAVDVTPQQVMDCLVAAGVKNWVLMGLHGYVGYLPMPRATQDVAVMVPNSQKNIAKKAIATQWPMLECRELSQVVRFMDPGDLDSKGQPKPVVDIMLPWSKFQESILKHHVLVDPQTGNRIPTVEAAIVAKYAALVSPHREWEKKQQDSVDFRRIIRANYDAINRVTLTQLAQEVWEQGGDELLSFIEIAMEDKPFPI